MERLHLAGSWVQAVATDMLWRYIHCIATGKVGDILIRSSYTKLGARLRIEVLQGATTRDAADSLYSVACLLRGKLP